MRSSWKFFIVVELLLLVWALYQIVGNGPILLFMAFAVLNLIYTLKKTHKTSFNYFQKVASLLVIVLCLLSSPAVWLMIILAIVFIGLIGVEISGLSIFEHAPWNKKQIHIVKTTSSESKSGKRFKRPWVGNQRIGNNTYEWDDINFSLLLGDTIIDLGNTLLPKQDNVIIVRKGFGRTRILVPTGVGVLLEHSSMVGNVTFEQESYQLRNESLKLYSGEYDQAARRLKIVTSTLFGDLEVIYI